MGAGDRNMEIQAVPRPRPSDTAAARDPSHANTLQDWRRLFRARLGDRRFWFVQGMVCVVTAGHAAVELFEHASGAPLDAVYFVPASLYFFPVLYASLNFGREGAVPTALWSAFLAIPNIVIWHQGLEMVGETFQMTMMIFLAALVAWRVDKEVDARQRAQTMEQARTLSEVKYRALFDSAAEPILVLAGDGVILESNAAAAALLGGTADSLRGSTAAQVMGQAAAEALTVAMTDPEHTTDLRVTGPDGSDSWFEPLCTAVTSATGEVLVQVLFQDITERRGFQHYARAITRAQEDERLRIAQELHDVSVQSAILICRRLDAATEAAEQGSLPDVTRTITEARHTAETMADELRRFSRDLRPLILDDLGLVPALKRLLLELRERSSVDVRFDVTGTVRRLDPSVELVLFRIGQEALRNMENHAAASRASLRITFATSNVRLTVTDNGLGFTVPRLTNLVSAGRLGLLGMQERAQLVSGRCEIRSTPGAGTRVVVEVPTANAVPAEIQAT